MLRLELTFWEKWGSTHFWHVGAKCAEPWKWGIRTWRLPEVTCSQMRCKIQSIVFFLLRNISKRFRTSVGQKHEIKLCIIRIHQILSLRSREIRISCILTKKKLFYYTYEKTVKLNSDLRQKDYASLDSHLGLRFSNMFYFWRWSIVFRKIILLFSLFFRL